MLQVALEEIKGESQSATIARGSALTNHLQDNNNISSNEVVKDPKPHPFYLTVIVGNKLVHNCMVDSGASSSVMPKEIADKLGLKYQPLEKGVVQLDGIAVNTLGIIKGLNLTLHASPNFVVPQDICIIDLPPYFSMCLSRDFTAKIGGYLSADWSHMLFRTRYGTKFTIKS